MSRKTLTVTCKSGLVNRLRVLSSGLALAEATNREFVMEWPSEYQTCGASFGDLFDSAWPVREVQDIGDESSWLSPNGWFEDLPDLVHSPEDHLRVCWVGWLVDPARSDRHRAISSRAEELARELAPKASLQERIDRIHQSFGPVTIGAHVRRGDFLSVQPDAVGNLDAIISTIRSKINRTPSHVFLATDDGASPGYGALPETEGVREAFRTEFGELLIESEPISLDRGQLVAIEDAVIDLYLLRRCDLIVGTKRSSFSAFAAVGRDVSLVLCEGEANSPRSRLARTLEWTKFSMLLSRWSKWRFGKEVPIPVLIITARRSYWRKRAQLVALVPSAMVERLRHIRDLLRRL